MQELYFQQLKNRDVGPFSANQIRQMIRSGRIQSSDRLRVGGEAVAYRTSEFLAFRDELERTTAEETNGRRWVCMRARDMRSGSTSAMCGPYTRKELVSLLMRGELTSTDYVWREGFTAWRTLESVEQLQLPVPRTLIKWNSGALDWSTRETAPATQMSRMPAAPAFLRTTWIDHVLDAAIVACCGAFALICWKLFFHHQPVRAAYMGRRAAAAEARPLARPPAHRTPPAQLKQNPKRPAARPTRAASGYRTQSI